MPDLTIEDFEEILEMEKTALKISDFETLEKIAEQKEQIVEQIQVLADQLDAEAIERLRHMTLQNQRLQEATMNGLRSVMDRLDASRRVALHLDTYNAKGKREDLSVPQATLEKRA